VWSAPHVPAQTRSDHPADPAEDGSRPTLSAVLARQLDHISDQAFFVSASTRQLSLCGSVLAQNTTDPSLRHAHLAADQVDAGTTT